MYVCMYVLSNTYMQISRRPKAIILLNNLLLSKFMDSTVYRVTSWNVNNSPEYNLILLFTRLHM